MTQWRLAPSAFSFPKFWPRAASGACGRLRFLVGALRWNSSVAATDNAFFLVGAPGFPKNGRVPRTTYFDYNATTPLDPAVRDAMLPFLGEVWGNPSSVHHVGREARARLDDARDRAAKFLGAKPSEIIFTSGGTESNNLAVLGTARSLKAKGRHLITSSVEHHAVLHALDYLEKTEGFELTRLAVDAGGRVARG